MAGRTLYVKLGSSDWDDTDNIVKQIGQHIGEGYTSGVDFPVNWQIKTFEEPFMDFMGDVEGTTIKASSYGK